MKVDRIIVGSLNTNCYILSIKNCCMIIDPGDEYDKIKKEIDGKDVVGVLITHSHFDHIGALRFFDKKIVYDKSNLLEKEYIIDSFKFNIIYTPGHKEDSITIYFKNENIMFTGDFIFKDGIGRTDLEGGNYTYMLNSLDKMKKYSKNIVIYPGHGENSTLGKELHKY